MIAPSIWFVVDGKQNIKIVKQFSYFQCIWSELDCLVSISKPQYAEQPSLLKTAKSGFFLLLFVYF